MIAAAELLAMVDGFVGKYIWIEEQDHRFYIIHLDAESHVHEPDGTKWVVVSSESPLYPALKQLHHR